MKVVTNLVKRTLALFDLELRRKNVEHVARNSMYGALEHVKGLGFYPRSIIDVGAASGTPPLIEVFPDAKQILLEPLEEFEPFLAKLSRERPNVDYVMAAAAKESGIITINVHPDLVGSSIYMEAENSDVNGTPRTVPAISLDDLCQQRGIEGPLLLKLDVQGAELDVLQGGGESTLARTEYVLLEANLFRFFDGGPLFQDISKFMDDRGFVVYDILSPLYRPLDGALAQVDVAFVKKQGRFRKNHTYATIEQRRAQNQDYINRFGQ